MSYISTLFERRVHQMITVWLLENYSVIFVDEPIGGSQFDARLERSAC